jgi:hypothetical protein
LTGYTDITTKYGISCGLIDIQNKQTEYKPRALSLNEIVVPRSFYISTFYHRHYVTSRKVARSIPKGVTGIFRWHNSSGRPMALGLTQPLTEIRHQECFLGKGGRCVGLTNLRHLCADCLEIWEPQPPGNIRACPGL